MFTPTAFEVVYNCTVLPMGQIRRNTLNSNKITTANNTIQPQHNRTVDYRPPAHSKRVSRL